MKGKIQECNERQLKNNVLLLLMLLNEYCYQKKIAVNLRRICNESLIVGISLNVCLNSALRKRRHERLIQMDV